MDLEFFVEAGKRAEDIHRSLLESNGAGDFDKRNMRELMMYMSPFESNGAEVLL